VPVLILLRLIPNLYLLHKTLLILYDKGNCISKYTRIKKAVTKEFVHILQCEISVDPNSNNGQLLNLNNDLLYDKKETIILPFQPDLKFIHKILQKIKPMSNKMRSV
jgi:hypothetical protein